MGGDRSRQLLGLAVGVAAVAGVTLVRASLTWLLGDNMPLLLFVWAVLAAAWIGGAIPGLATTVLAVVVGVFVVIGPSTFVADSGEWFRAVTFTLEGVTLSLAMQALHTRNARLRSTTRELEEERRHLERMSLEDPMTGLGNRRAFEREMRTALALRAREGTGLTLLIADVNGLKLTNDAQGHEAGDGLLIASASALTVASRASDSAFRIGGDEFALIMPGTDREEYEGIRARLEQAVELATAGFPGTGVSIGAAHAPSDGASLDVLLRVADERMYAAKAESRRRDS